jgi:surface antigen
MKRTGYIAVASAVALSGALQVAHAQIGSVIKGTPAELFNQEDNRRLAAALRKALDEGIDNEPVNWENPATSHRGDATVVKRFQSQGRACKELRLRNEAGSRRGESRVNACQVDGRWMLMGSSQIN